MKLRRVNNTLEVSEIGLGLWSIATDEWGSDINKAEELLRKAYDAGINFYDTADVYGKGLGEKIISKVLGTKRDRIVILTKIGLDFYHNTRPVGNYDIEYLKFAFEQSLKRLNTDYVDILMLHNPKGNVIRDTKVINFFQSLKKEGKVRVIGVALGPTLGWGEEGIDAIKMGYESLEYIFNLIEVKPGIDFLNYDIGHFVRVPHASDALNEDKWPIEYDPKLHRHFKDISWINRAIERSKELIPFANKKGMKLSQLALKFILYNKRVSSVIPNISNERELVEFVKVEDLPDLTEEDYNYLISFYERNFIELNKESIEETKRYK